MRMGCRIACLVAALSLAAWSTVQAQDSLGIRCLSRLDYWDGATSVQMFGPLAFMSGGYEGLRIMNLSDPAHPNEIGRQSVWTSWNSQSCAVYVSGSQAFVTFIDDGRVLDISDPTNPVETHHWNLPGTPSVVFAHGNVAVGLRNDDEETPCLMDISDLDNVHITGNFTGLSGPSRPVGVVDDYLCMAGWGVTLYDISDPAQPVRVASVDDSLPLYYGWSAKLSGHYVYLSTVNDGLRIVDVANPLQPVEVAACDTGWCGNITVANSHVFVSKFWGLDIWDVTDPTQPLFAGVYPLPIGVPNSWVASSGNYLCVGLNYSGDQAVTVLDISNSVVPVEISRFGKMGNLRRMTISSTTGYVSDMYTGFHVVNIASSPEVSEVSRTLGVHSFPDVAACGDYIYGVDYNYGLVTYHETELAQPESLTCWQRIGVFHPQLIAASGNYAYVFDEGNNGGFIWTFSLARPEAPMPVDSVPFSYATRLMLGNGYLYVVEPGYFDVFALSDPASPQLVGSCVLPQWLGAYASEAALAGHYAYVADYDGGIRIIDIAQPTNPVEVSSVDGTTIATVVTNGNMLVFYSQPMLYAMDLGDPVHPEYVGHYSITEEMSDLKIFGSYLLTASPNRISVYQVDGLSDVQSSNVIPSQFSLHPAYPNPFNPSTVIAFSLPKTQHAKLTVYDITGREVKVLEDAVLSAGGHRVTFDGSALASGMYFARLDAGKNVKTEKLMLLK